MTRYTFSNTNKQIYQLAVRQTRNGYTIQAVNTAQVVCIPLTKEVAASLDITLPDTYRIEYNTAESAQYELDTIADTNGLVAIKDTDMN